MEDRKGCVRIFSNLHARLDVMGSHAALRQLQPQPAYATVLSRPTVRSSSAQRLAQDVGIDGNESQLSNRRRLGKASIVLR